MPSFTVPVLTVFYQGNVAPNALVYTYASGTTTPVATYADAALTQPNPDPIVCDSNGQVSFYMGTGAAIRLDCKTSGGTLIRTIDPVYPVPDLGGFTGNGTDLNKIAGITNGTILANKAIVVDSGNAANGLATKSVGQHSSYVASMDAVMSSMTGGFVNMFDNGTFAVWQRGTNGTVTAGNTAYTADRFMLQAAGNDVSWQRLFSGGLTKYMMRLTGQAGITNAALIYRLDSDRSCQLAGRVITVQAKVNNSSGAAFTPTLTVRHANAVDNWTSGTTDINGVSLQTCPNGTATIVAYSFLADANTINGLEITFALGNALAGTGRTVDFAELDMRITIGVTPGQNQSPPSIEIRPAPVEETLCRKYLRVFMPNSSSFPLLYMGQAYSTTAAIILLPLDPPMRVAPTGTNVSAASDFSVLNASGTRIACTNLAFASSSLNSVSLAATVASGLAAGNATVLVPNNTAASPMLTGAEL